VLLLDIILTDINTAECAIEYQVYKIAIAYIACSIFATSLAESLKNKETTSSAKL
jgi:hypothetical protein